MSELTSTKMISDLYENDKITYKAMVALLLQIENEKIDLLKQFYELQDYFKSIDK
jgi:hypothetical protein